MIDYSKVSYIGEHKIIIDGVLTTYNNLGIIKNDVEEGYQEYLDSFVKKSKEEK